MGGEGAKHQKRGHRRLQKIAISWRGSSKSRIPLIFSLALEHMF
jgi:hypothetical protein